MKTTFNPPFDCKLCNKQYEKLQHLVNHILNLHNMNYKEYYDQFLKLENEEQCKICKTPTIFYKGKYRNYCTLKCQNNDPKTKLKNSEGVKKFKASRTTEQIKKENKTRKETIIKKYGVENISQLDNIKNKVKNTSFKHYGDWYVNTDKCKKAFKDKYGVDRVDQIPYIKERTKNTNLNRYGVLHPMQNREILSRCMKNARKLKQYILPSGRIIYKQGYELQFLDYIFKNNILNEDEIDYNPKRIKYVSKDGIEHYYFPDFSISKWNLIVEIKSNFVLEKQGTENQKIKEEFTRKQGYNFILILDNNKILDFTKFNELFIPRKI